MSNKTNSVSKSSFDRCTKSTKGSSCKSDKSFKNIPRKVIASKKIPSNCVESKSCSSGVVATKKCPVKPKKTTKSESTVTKKCLNSEELVDYCKKCGDEKSNRAIIYDKVSTILSSLNVKCVKNDNSLKIENGISKPVQQYYKNENFYTYEESVHETNNNNKKASLDTIREVSELHTISENSIFKIYSDFEDDVTYLDPSSDENIKNLKEFRQKNYFECHSAKSRIKTKASVTSLQDHKCVYRFYLNDRLFPVPLNTDHNNIVRCVECHLPMDIKQDDSGEKINGTIQAKVKLSAEGAQDILLLLPVKDSLIIEERRKQNRNKDEYVYFGVVKLSADGNSIFNRTLPEDSLALKYQKGYQEYKPDDRYKYKKLKDDDVIII